MLSIHSIFDSCIDHPHRPQEAMVEYDGRALYFPNGTDIDMIAQAKRQSQAIRISVSAHPSQAADHSNDNTHRPPTGPEGPG